MKFKSEKHKKGQIAGQIFIYIMAAIIIGVIVFIGYKAIAGVLTKTCNAEKVSFKSDIEGLIEKYNSYGSVNTKTFKAPCEYDMICFVDAGDINPNAAWGFTCDSNKIIRQSVVDQVRQNIFVVSNKNTISIGYSDLIGLNSTDQGKCLCINQLNGNFNIRFSGRGATTEISKV